MTESTETKQEQPHSESGCGAGPAFFRGAGEHAAL